MILVAVCQFCEVWTGCRLNAGRRATTLLTLRTKSAHSSEFGRFSNLSAKSIEFGVITTREFQIDVLATLIGVVTDTRSLVFSGGFC